MTPDQRKTLTVAIFALVVMAACVAAVVVTGCSSPTPEPQQVVKFAYICDGCGETFTSDTPIRIKQEFCPLCPMTEEEFRLLQEQLRRQKEATEGGEP